MRTPLLAPVLALACASTTGDSGTDAATGSSGGLETGGLDATGDDDATSSSTTGASTTGAGATGGAEATGTNGGSASESGAEGSTGSEGSDTGADPGFTFEVMGTDFTYTDDERSFGGIFVKPEGDGPFPAILVDHGQGGTAEGFSLPRANEFAALGLVVIGPSLTHEAGGDTTPEGSGNSPENLARGLACADVLEWLPYVDDTRIAVFGHSKGAYAAIAQVAALGDRVRAAGITAGGVVDDGAGVDQAAPTTTEASGITAPFVMFHGEGDMAVPAERSQALVDLLDGTGVENERHVYATDEHNLHEDPTIKADIDAKLQAWLTAHGVLP